MSNKYHDDEIIGKAYDTKLMNRLLKYAKPYWKYLLLAVVLMIAVTGLELLRPYLLKTAIDEYITGYKKPMYEMKTDSPHEGIIFNGKKYVKTEIVDKELDIKTAPYPIVNIIQKDKQYYIGDIKNENIENRMLLSSEDYMNFRDTDIKGINKISIVFLLSIIFAFVFNYLQVLMLNYTSQKIVFNIRQDLFSHIQSLSISYFDKNPIGRLVTRVTNDTETLNEMYTGVLVNLLKDIFILFGIIFIMIRMNLTLALISLSLVPLILIVSIVFRKKIRVIYRLSRAQLAKINSTLNENITGMRTIQIFKKEDKISRQFDKINKEYLNTAKKEISLFAIFRPSIEVIRSLGIASIVYFGGGQVVSNVIEFGVLYAFID